MSVSNDFSPTHQSDAHHSSRKNDINVKEKKAASGSPSKKHRSQPVIRTPEKNKDTLPELKLHELPKPDQTVFDNFKSPVGSISLRGRLVKSPTDTSDAPNSARSPKSPRSPRNEYEVMSSRRHRIDSPRSNRAGQQQAPALVSSPTLTTTKTVTQTVTQTVTSPMAASTATDNFRGNINAPTSPPRDAVSSTVVRQRLSSPPATVSLNQQTPEQMNDLADLWVKHLLGSLSSTSSDHMPLLTDAKIDVLGRGDGIVVKSSLKPALFDLKMPNDKQAMVSLSSLLNSMLANHLSQSVMGKTIKTMQVTVMHANQKLAAISFDDMIKLDDENKGEEVRQQMANASIGHASACVDVAFGPSRKLSESHLPQALLDFWKLVDAKFVKEVKKNPTHTAEQILTARKNLGFDLLVTRQMFAFAAKPAQAMTGTEVKPTRVSADTAIPALVRAFANVMSAELHKVWPAFFANAIASFDA
jgi:hypothetical protein